MGRGDQRRPHSPLVRAGQRQPGTGRAHYQVEGNAGGTIVVCEAQSHFGLTWEFGGDTSWVEVQVWEEGDGRIGLSLVHTALLSEHWEQFGAGAVGVGWETAFLGLALHSADPSGFKPDMEEFATSADGRAFIHGSSEGWVPGADSGGNGTGGGQSRGGKDGGVLYGGGGWLTGAHLRLTLGPFVL